MTDRIDRQNFVKKLKAVFSVFSITKNIVVPRLFKSLPVKPIYYISFNLFCLLKSLAINL